MRKLILFAIIMLALSGIFNKVNAQPYYKPIGPATAQPNWYVWSNVGLKVDDSLWLTEYAGDSVIVCIGSGGKMFTLNKNFFARASDVGGIGLQSVLDNGNVADTGVHLINYINPDPVSGVSKYSSYLTRIEHASTPTEIAATVQLNDKWVIDTTVVGPIYNVLSTPIFDITDSAHSGIRHQGIVSNVNVTDNSKGFFKNSWMVVSGGNFKDSVRIQSYAGFVAHNPVAADTIDYCYGMKLGGFNVGNYKNATTLALGFVSADVNGTWDIYVSQHNQKNNYLGSRRTMIGLPTSIELDSSATLQTTTFTSSGLAKYTSNLSGSLTNLSLPQKVYVDSLYTVTGIITSGKIPYTDTVSRLIPTKKYIDSVLLIYLVANGATIDANGRLTLPASGGTNGGIKVNGTLYLQTADTQSAGGGTVRAGLSGYYTLTSGTRGVMQTFGTFAPTSGNAVFSAYSANVGISQTGTANGITSSYLAVNPTTASDYRAFRAPNTSGVAFYNENSGARNIFLGETQIGSATDAGAYQLQVTGNSIFTGSTTGISYNDLTFPFATTSAATLSPTVNTTYNFTGTTSTWTLPVVSGNSGKFIEVLNVGTGIITVNSNNGVSTDIFTTTAVNTTAVAAGATVTFFNNGTYWKVK